MVTHVDLRARLWVRRDKCSQANNVLFEKNAQKNSQNRTNNSFHL